MVVIARFDPAVNEHVTAVLQLGASVRYTGVLSGGSVAVIEFHLATLPVNVYMYYAPTLWGLVFQGKDMSFCLCKMRLLRVCVCACVCV